MLPCPAGSFSAGGSAINCTPCPAGTFSNGAAGQSSEGAACTDPVPGARYRWALAEAAWTQKGPLTARRGSRPGGDVPEWALATPLWLLSLSHAPGDAPAAVAAAARAFQSAALANASSFGLHWYRWNEELFDTDYPRYTARPGFAEAVAGLRRNASGQPPPIYTVRM